jgi:predicted negative regulator of RcsB-dependent stress response
MSGKPKARRFVFAALFLAALGLTLLWRFWVPGSIEREFEEYAVYSTIIEADQTAGSRPKEPAAIMIESNPETIYQKPILFFFLRGFRSFQK